MNLLAFINIYVLNVVSLTLLVFFAILIILFFKKNINIEIFVSLITLILTLWFSFLTPFYPKVSIGKSIFLGICGFETKGETKKIPFINVKIGVVNNNAIGGALENMALNVFINNQSVGIFNAMRESDRLQILPKNKNNLAEIQPDVFSGIIVESKSSKVVNIIFMPQEYKDNIFPKLPYDIELELKYKIGNLWIQTKRVKFKNNAVNMADINLLPYGVITE